MVDALDRPQGDEMLIPDRCGNSTRWGGLLFDFESVALGFTPYSVRIDRAFQRGFLINRQCSLILLRAIRWSIRSMN